jgi:hypothetical protein
MTELELNFPLLLIAAQAAIKESKGDYCILPISKSDPPDFWADRFFAKSFVLDLGGGSISRHLP